MPKFSVGQQVRYTGELRYMEVGVLIKGRGDQSLVEYPDESRTWLFTPWLIAAKDQQAINDERQHSKEAHALRLRMGT